MTKEAFKEAYREAMAEEFTHVPQEEAHIDYTFSEDFTKRTEKLVRSERSAKWRWVNSAGKQAAAIAAAVLILFSIAMSVKGIREQVIRFFSAYGEANMGHETVDTGSGSQQTDPNETVDTGTGSQQTAPSKPVSSVIGVLQVDNTATVDIEVVPRFSAQGGSDIHEDTSLYGVGFIDSTTALGETFPIYINPYPTGQEGPLYEITDALKATMMDNLARYLSYLYEDFDPQSATFTSDADRPYMVEYIKEGTMFGSYATGIKVSSSDYAQVRDISAAALLDHALVKAAVSYLGLTDPVVSTTVDYRLDGTESCLTYKITDKASDTMQHIHNINFAYITVKQYEGLDSVSISIQNPVELIKHADVQPLSYSFVLAELAKLYPGMDTEDVQAEIYYSTFIEPGYYIPCYRLYIRGSDTASGSDIRYGSVYVVLADQSENN